MPKGHLLAIRQRQISYDIVYVWNIKKWYTLTYSQNRSKGHRCRKQAYGYHGESAGGTNWVIGMDIHTLLYI